MAVPRVVLYSDPDTSNFRRHIDGVPAHAGTVEFASYHLAEFPLVLRHALSVDDIEAVRATVVTLDRMVGRLPRVTLPAGPLGLRARILDFRTEPLETSLVRQDMVVLGSLPLLPRT